MKHCPICDEHFDDEVIRFCTKDGTPLVDDELPSFTALPSEKSVDRNDEFGEDTVIRRKPGTESGLPVTPDQSERIVIPTMPVVEQQVRPRPAAVYYQPPEQQNTPKIVALTIAGTLVVLTFGALLFWLLQKDNTPQANMFANTNGNFLNQNTNVNSNLGFDSNFNFNSNNFNTNYNLNTNFNANFKTPSPSPSPRPTQTTPLPSPSPLQSISPTPRPTVRPTVMPTPRLSPRPTIDRPPPPGNDAP